MKYTCTNTARVAMFTIWDMANDERQKIYMAKENKEEAEKHQYTLSVLIELHQVLAMKYHILSKGQFDLYDNKHKKVYRKMR